MTQDVIQESGRSRKWPRINGFWRVVGVVVVVYLFLRVAFSYLSQWIMGAENPLPVPRVLLSIYMILAIMAILVQVAINDQTLRDFLDPLADLLRGPPKGDPRAADGRYRLLRIATLAILPVLVGWTVYQQLVPKVASAATSRQQHPTIPESYVSLENPFRTKSEAEQKQAIAEGIVLYQTNCRPCHGTPARGDGPMAPGFKPRPIAFTDVGTIETIVESYLMWRVEKGGIGLPAAATPWNSAMPPWEGELTRDEIWKIIMAEFHIAGKEPRIPEGHE